MKKWKLIVASLLIFIVGVWLFRFPILKSFGNYLIYENELKKADAIFVLGGGAFERGNEAAKIFKQGWAPKIICTSGNYPKDYVCLGLPHAESDATRINIIRQGVPDSAVIAIREGTSTFEEAEIITDYCKKNSIDTAILLSSRFHTRRIKRVFFKEGKEAGITFLIHGAPATDYEENKWWQSEYGLIAVNNEYIKLFYYAVKYGN